MKRRVLFLLATFAVSVALFALQKPAFMLYNWSEAGAVALVDWLAVIWHGLSLDMTVAGYVTALPALLTIVSVWWRGDWWRLIFKIYFLVLALVISTVFVVDMALYPYWGFRIESSLLFYLASPADAAASVPAWLFVRQVLLGIIYGAIFYFAFSKLVISLFDGSKPRLPLLSSAVLLLMGGSLILPIRGGLSASTANEGRAYFSSNMFLNHSAVNACFSLIASSLQQREFSEQYKFFDEQERARIFEQITHNSVLKNATDSTCLSDSVDVRKILTTDRPNVILIILESFSANAIEVLGGDKETTPNINALAAEGVLFKHMYANSFRTDRGLVAVLNGYPAQPTTSVMKYPAKSQTLPAIAAKLSGEGYNTSVYYGGDIDFTNMRSYFYASGFHSVVGQDGLSFPVRKSRWGFNDALMFDHLVGEIRRFPEPFFTTMLTLSSHEPFDVPYVKLEDPYLNSMAFTDHCIGRFVDSLKQLPLWDRTLIVMVSDHGYRYPETIGNNSVARQHIPMLWIGGAVAQPCVVESIASQTDIAATLLSQLDINISEFTFSKNLFDRRAPRGAIYTFNNGVGIIDSTGNTLWDFTTGHLIESAATDPGNDRRTAQGKAYVQTLMQDFDAR